MHGETYKARWFVLARVPHGTVLIYYDRKCMDEAHIVGFIDMRQVIAVQEGNRTITFNALRSKSSLLYTAQTTSLIVLYLLTHLSLHFHLIIRSK